MIIHDMYKVDYSLLLWNYFPLEDLLRLGSKRKQHKEIIGYLYNY